MSIISLVFTAIGLAMDAFAVSITIGLKGKREEKKKLALTAGLYFGGFQALMPFIGWILGIKFTKYIQSVDHWIAFILLSIIGAKMLIDSLRQDIQQYHRARVGDLYERIVPRIQAGNTFMNFKYGWTEQHFNNLGYHKIYTNEFGPEHNGDWVLDLPKPVSIVNI